MKETVGRVRLIVSLWRQYGTAHCIYRTWYALARRTGWLKRRFPTPPWSTVDPRSLFADGVPVEPAAYVARRRAATPAFFFPPGRLLRTPAAWSAPAVSEADAILNGSLRYFAGEAADLGFPFRWLTNPWTGEQVDARRHWCDRDDFEPGQGDIRYFWEPSRFLWVYTLARAYAATGDERYPEAFWSLLESWRDANPINRGPNWQCGQECALRSMALCFGLYAFQASPSTTAERERDLVVLLGVHGERVAANIHFARTQRGNHAVSEAAALYTLGVLFPELLGAGAWRRRGLAVLEDEMRLHNRNDGSYVQHSMNYQRLMLHNYLWALRLAQIHGDRFSARTISRLDRSADFLYQLQEPGTGRVPNYGPNDGSLILPLNSCDFLDYRPVIGSIHALLHRRRLYPPGPWDEDVLWLMGDDAPDAAATAPERTTRAFQEGGYYALRGRTTWGMVRCHSFHSRPNHSDLLHLDLWWKGVNLLRDSGTYSYNPEERWRDQFASTRAHNTVEVGGRDQMVKVHRFTWVRLARSRLRRFVPQIAPGVDLFDGEHFGYRRLPSRAIHRRAVLRLADDLWLIVDDLTGRGREKTRLLWHLADDAAVTEPGRVTIRSAAGRAVLEVRSTAGMPALHLVRGGEGDIPLGWVSLHYGERLPAPAVSASIEADLPQRFVTLVRLGGEGEFASDAALREVRATIQGRVGDLHVRLAAVGVGQGSLIETLTWQGGEPVPGSREGDLPNRFAIEPLRRADIPEVVAVHLRSFPGYLLSHLGPEFLRRFYSEFCLHAYDYGVVAREVGSGRLVGFVAGTSQAAAHRRAFFWRHAPYILFRGMIGFLSDGTIREAIMLGVGRRLRLSSGPPANVCPVRLLSIGVDPELQGSGIARLAAERFEAVLKAAGHDRVGLSVRPDNQRAIAFYLKTGWTMTHRSAAGCWFEKGLATSPPRSSARDRDV
jgi:asparagine synthase (glutamine-hydrolysing)